ncbi:MAG: O-antigen ligase family protein [Desulfovermiculus sp.]|nr:O-antigen ligase family protein [Desulfovermiculus sp.]
MRPVQSSQIEMTSYDSQAELASNVNLKSPMGILGSLKNLWKAFWQEHACFILTCIYLVFEYNRPQHIYPAINIIPWAQTLILLAIFLAFFDRTSKSPPKAAVLPMLAFSFCVLFSMLNAYSPSIAAKHWIDFFGWVFVVFLLTGVVNTRIRLFLFISVYFLVNLKMAQHGFRSWAMGGFGFSGWGVTGSPGWFQNSGEFSMQMAVFLPMVLAYVAKYRQEWSIGIRMFFYLLTIMAVGSIIGSSSRGGILGLVMVGLWKLLFSRKRIKVLAFLAVSTMIIIVSMPEQFKDRFKTIGEDTTSVSRLEYWDYAKETFSKHPLTGIGFRNWPIWVSNTKPELKGNINRTEAVHNTYWEVATELGILGTIVYFLILLQIFIINCSLARKARITNDRFLEATSLGLCGSLLVYLVTSYFMSVLYYPYIWILLSLTVCSSLIYHKSIEQETK